MDGTGGVRVAVEVVERLKEAGRATKGAECDPQSQILVNVMPTSDPVLTLEKTQNRGIGSLAETQPTQSSIDSVTQMAVLRLITMS